jgi:hypothetical protein
MKSIVGMFFLSKTVGKAPNFYIYKKQTVQAYLQKRRKKEERTKNYTTEANQAS